MLKINNKAPVLLGLVSALALVGCEGNNSSTSIDPIVKIEFEEIDKEMVADDWTVNNYIEVASLGYSTIADNLNVRSALLGHERNLAAFLNLYSKSGRVSCDIGYMDISLDQGTRVEYHSCQLGDVLFDGASWTSVNVECDATTVANPQVTDTFIIGYKDYRQKQKLNDSASYSQMYGNGEYEFKTYSVLDEDEITEVYECPKGDETNSTVTFSPVKYTVITVEADGTETEDDYENASYQMQPDIGYIEYQDLELTESVAGSSTYGISGMINMNLLGQDIDLVGSGFMYGLNGKSTSGFLELGKGDSKITLEFTAESVKATLDLNTNIPGTDKEDTIAQEDF